MQNKYNPIIFAFLIAVGIFIGQKLSNKDQVRINDKINSIIQLINSHYVDTLNNNFEEDIFSMNKIWNRSIENDRLMGFNN